MAKSAHTPGPWKYEGDEVYSPAAYQSVCMVLLTDDAAANGALIAAAPELLQALQGLLYAPWDRDALMGGSLQMQAMANARAAIAKAIEPPVENKQIADID